MNIVPIARVAVLATFGLMSWVPGDRRALAEPGTIPPGVASSPALAPATAPTSASLGPNLVLNGDFETNYFFATGCHFNLSNTTVSNAMVNIEAFGLANEIDVMNNGTSCTYAGPPQSGTTKLAIAGRGVRGECDAFCFDLSSPVTLGNVYTVTFYAWTDLTFDPDIPTIQIGLSSSALAFGIPVFSGVPASTGWTLMTSTFFAPVDAAFLSVRVDPNTAGWIHIDNFMLHAGGPTPVAQRTWGEMKSSFSRP